MDKETSMITRVRDDNASFVVDDIGLAPCTAHQQLFGGILFLSSVRHV